MLAMLMEERCFAIRCLLSGTPCASAILVMSFVSSCILSRDEELICFRLGPDLVCVCFPTVSQYTWAGTISRRFVKLCHAEKSMFPFPSNQNTAVKMLVGTN